LVERYGWQCEGLKAVGYREWQGYFLGKKSLEKTKFEIIKDTKNLAKKQRTWFRRNKSIQWFITPVNREDVVDLITTFIN
jgi:tRNA dimethylallyltransferase